MGTVHIHVHASFDVHMCMWIVHDYALMVHVGLFLL